MGQCPPSSLILRSVPGFYVTYDRNYSYLGVRGFGRPGDYNSRILLLVDGHRVNDNIYDQAYLGTDFPVDIDLIDRVEVIRGPNFLRFVASGLLGVINVVTQSVRGAQGLTVSGELGSAKAKGKKQKAKVKTQDARTFDFWVLRFAF